MTSKRTGRNPTRNGISYRFLRAALMPVYKRLYHFEYERTELDADEYPNYIVVANHVTNADPVLISMSFPRPMYYVCTDELLHISVFSALLCHLLSPVPRMKGAPAINTVRGVLRELKEGSSICFFPEGGRTFDGCTQQIPEATGKLVKQAGTALVTYKFTGGYFTAPRWSRRIRHGAMRGETVGIYSAEKLKEMTSDEIDAIIERDIYEDANVTQKKQKQVYRSKHLAENLECALYYCPECGGLGTMSSAGNTLKCECGAQVTMDEYGSLQGGRFGSITAWNDCQSDFMRGYARSGGLSDKNVGIIMMDESRKRSRPVNLGLRGINIADRVMTFGDESNEEKQKVFNVDAIYNIELIGRSRLVFEYGGVHYELDGGRRFKARMYYDYLKAVGMLAASDELERII